jgi:hypothetical protein
MEEIDLLRGAVFAQRVSTSRLMIIPNTSPIASSRATWNQPPPNSAATPSLPISASVRRANPSFVSARCPCRTSRVAAPRTRSVSLGSLHLRRTRPTLGIRRARRQSDDHQRLSDLARVELTRRGDVVVAELPTYFISSPPTSWPTEDSSPLVLGWVRQRGRGRGRRGSLRPGRVRGAVRDPNDALRPKILYHNWSPRTRIRGVGLFTSGTANGLLYSREFGFFFAVADEMYHLLHWGDEPPPRRLAQIEREMEEMEGEDVR